MSPLKLAVFSTALCFCVFSNLVFVINRVSGDVAPSSASSSNCVTCTTCLCPPAGGEPLYSSPPPPPQTVEYAPPSQQPSRPAKCPPGQFQCCQNPQGYSPPGIPGQFPQYPPPPGTFPGGGGYVPYPYGSASSSALSTLVTAVMLMMALLFSSGASFMF